LDFTSPTYEKRKFRKKEREKKNERKNSVEIQGGGEMPPKAKEETSATY
jgi:hypothetical protein